MNTPTLPVDPERVMLAGDWHGNAAWAVHAVEHTAVLGLDTILHLGDFGFWTDGPGTERYLAEVNDALTRRDMQLFWVDGNHEDHVRLNKVPIDEDTGLRPITDRIAHLPRGFRWAWHGRQWMAVGGAASVDRLMRKEGVSWWPEELLTDDDVARAISGGKVDVIVAHDAPDKVHIPHLPPDDTWPPSVLAVANRHRERLGEIVDATRPTVYFHGHYHVRYQGYRGHTVVIGLAEDGTSMGKNLMKFRPGDPEN